MGSTFTGHLTNIAESIRTKAGTTEKMLVSEMASNISAIETGGGASWAECMAVAEPFFKAIEIEEAPSIDDGFGVDVTIEVTEVIA